MKVVRVHKVRRYKCGYELRTETVDSGCGEQTKWTMAYTPNGDYIGNPKTAHRLIAKRGIQPIKTNSNNCVCSIGYSVNDGKWYGWSHRAIYGFRPGSTCKKGDCHYVSRRHGGKGAWIAKTTADAKRMALDFAEGVS